MGFSREAEGFGGSALHVCGLRLQGLGFRVQGLGFGSVLDLAVPVRLGLEVLGLGRFRV